MLIILMILTEMVVEGDDGMFFPAFVVEALKPVSESEGQGLPLTADKVEEVIVDKPEPVQVFDASYNPMLSPETEELPSFPQIKEVAPNDSGVDLNTSNRSEASISLSQVPLTEVEFSELAAADLDAHIGELQLELEKCKDSSPSGSPSTTSPPPPVGNLIPENKNVERVMPVTDPGVEFTCLNGSAPAEKVPDDFDRAPSSPSPWIISRRRILVSVLVVLFLIVLWMVMVFETNFCIPLASDLRRWPAVRKFRNRYYRPARKAVVRCLGW